MPLAPSRDETLTSGHPRLLGAPLGAVLIITAAGCHQAVGDRCDDALRCEVGLECIDGRCVPPAEPEGLDLLEVDETVTSSAVSGGVDIIVDELGTPHVYADTLGDAWAGVGFVMARHRFAQMDLARRAASGRLAEVVSDRDDDAASRDLLARLLGIRQAAEATWEATPAEAPEREALDGFARGVTAFIERARSGDEALPPEHAAIIESADTEWTAVDSLAVARLQLLRRAWSGDVELSLHLLAQRARATFSADSDNSSHARRVGFVEDVIRLDPIIEVAPWQPAAVRAASSFAVDDGPELDEDLAEGWSEAVSAIRRLAGPEDATLAWAGTGGITRSGGGQVTTAIDGALSLPASHYAVHIEARGGSGGGTRAAGLCAAGVPALESGFTANVAWSAAPSRADVADLYLETITATASGWLVRYGGDRVPLEPLHLSVPGADGTLLELETARVPHHGPMIPSLGDDGAERGFDRQGLSLRWIGAEPLRELALPSELVRADTTEAALLMVRQGEDPTRLWVLADRHGRAAGGLHGCVPTRAAGALGLDWRTGRGAAPCTVLPGEGEAEWTGCVAEELLPAPRVPAGSAFAVAGADISGGTASNTPFRSEPYLGWSFAPGYRASELAAVITDYGPRRRAALDEAAATVLDSRVGLVPALVPHLAAAANRAIEEREQSGTHTDLMRFVYESRDRMDLIEESRQRLEGWDGIAVLAGSGDADHDASVATTIAAAWVVELVDAVLGDELELLGVSAPEGLLARALLRLVAPTEALRTADPSTGESAIFDDLRTSSRPESRDERLLSSLDRALAWLEEQLGPDPEGWTWGALHTAHLRGLPVGTPGAGDLPDGAGFAMAGGHFTVVGCDPGLSDRDLGCDTAAVARLTVELTPWGPEAMVVLAGGQGGDPDDGLYASEVETWLAGGLRPLPFELEDVVAVARTRLRLEPGESPRD